MQAEIDDLKTQVKRLTPQNSSVPPSTQHPHARPVPKPKAKSKKKRGGQKGHRRVVRELVPVERCEEVIPLHPENCRRCGEGLVGSDPEPIRHQVWELPKIEPLIVEYQRHRLTCCGCGTTTCAALPLGVPTGQFGARLLAFTGLLMGHFRQARLPIADCSSRSPSEATGFRLETTCGNHVYPLAQISVGFDLVGNVPVR